MSELPGPVTEIMHKRGETKAVQQIPIGTNIYEFRVSLDGSRPETIIEGTSIPIDLRLVANTIKSTAEFIRDPLKPYMPKNEVADKSKDAADSLKANLDEMANEFRANYHPPTEAEENAMDKWANENPQILRLLGETVFEVLNETRTQGNPGHDMRHVHQDEWTTLFADEAQGIKMGYKVAGVIPGVLHDVGRLGEAQAYGKVALGELGTEHPKLSFYILNKILAPFENIYSPEDPNFKPFKQLLDEMRYAVLEHQGPNTESSIARAVQFGDRMQLLRELFAVRGWQADVGVDGRNLQFNNSDLTPENITNWLFGTVMGGKEPDTNLQLHLQFYLRNLRDNPGNEKVHAYEDELKAETLAFILLSSPTEINDILFAPELARENGQLELVKDPNDQQKKGLIQGQNGETYKYNEEFITNRARGYDLNVDEVSAINRNGAVLPNSQMLPKKLVSEKVWKRAKEIVADFRNKDKKPLDIETAKLEIRNTMMGILIPSPESITGDVAATDEELLQVIAKIDDLTPENTLNMLSAVRYIKDRLEYQHQEQVKFLRELSKQPDLHPLVRTSVDFLMSQPQYNIFEKPSQIKEELGIPSNEVVWRKLFIESTRGNGTFPQAFFAQGIEMAYTMAEFANQGISWDFLINNDPPKDILRNELEIAKERMHKLYGFVSTSGMMSADITNIYEADKRNAINFLESISRIVYETTEGKFFEGNNIELLSLIFNSPKYKTYVLEIISIAKNSLEGENVSKDAADYREQISNFMKKYADYSWFNQPASYNEERELLMENLTNIIRTSATKIRRDIIDNISTRNKQIARRLKDKDIDSLFGRVFVTRIDPLRNPDYE